MGLTEVMCAVRDVGDSGQGASGRAGRAEAGAPQDSVRHARLGSRPQQAFQVMWVYTAVTQLIVILQ